MAAKKKSKSKSSRIIVCFTGKGQAKAAAKKLRIDGKKAHIVNHDGQVCVKAGKKRVKKAKK